MQKQCPSALKHITAAVLIGWLVWFFMLWCYSDGFRKCGIQGGNSILRGSESAMVYFFVLVIGCICSTVLNAVMAHLVATTSDSLLKKRFYIVSLAFGIIGPLFYTY